MFLFAFISVLILLGISAYLAAIETAVTATSPGRIQKLKAEGNLKAITVLKLLKIKEQVISSLLIANSFFNTLCTTIATSVMIALYGEELGTIIASSVMTVLIIVFAEVIPKAIAVARAEQVILKTSTFVTIALKVLGPINYILKKILILFCKIFNIRLSQEISGTDEVRGVIEHHLEEGNVFKNDRDMLGGILDMGNMIVSEIMIHRSNMITLDGNLPIEQITKKALSSSHTRIPVWKDSKDNIVGILHIKDLLRSLYKNKFDYNKITLADFMTDAWFIPENALVSLQLHAFRQKRSHFALVIDEYGDLQGLVTLEDILEEIVGQIDDEHDKQQHQIVKKSPSKFMIEGSTSIRDVNRELNWNLPDEHASTFAGLVIHEMHKLPKQGEVVNLFDLKITIYHRQSNRITMLMVETLEKEGDRDI